MAHTGSWGTKDYGATEWLQKKLSPSKNLTDQGGSNLIGAPELLQGSNVDINNIGAQTPQPTTQPTTQTPGQTYQAPQPQQQAPQQQGGTPPVNMSFYQGWTDQNAIAQDWANTWQSKSGGGAGGQDQSQALNDIFNPQFQSLTDTENFLRDVSLPGAMQTAQENRQVGQGKLDKLLKEGEVSYGDKQQDLYDERRSALGDAMRMATALQKQAQGYGRGSSVGGAVSEIISKESMRGRSSIEKSYTKAIETAMKGFSTLQKTVVEKTSELELGFTQLTRNINEDFESKLLQIAGQRGMIESAKSQAKYDILQQSIQRTQELADMREIAKMELTQFANETSIALSNNLEEVQKALVASLTRNVEKPDNNFVYASQQKAPEYVTSQRFNAYPTDDDEFAGLFEPYNT